MESCCASMIFFAMRRTTAARAIRLPGSQPRWVTTLCPQPTTTCSANSKYYSANFRQNHYRTFVSRTAAIWKDALPYHLVVGLPALSPTMESGTLAEWYVKEGDSFSAGDGLAKIETDKASIDFEAQDDGYVAKILVKAGGNDIPIGTPIMVTVEEEENVAAFANFEAPATVGMAPTVATQKEDAVAAAPPPSPPPSKKEAATVAPPPPPPTPPPPVAAQSTPIITAPAPAAPEAAFSTAWGLSVVDSSPLAKTLAKGQNDYISKFGTTGQVPILAAA